MRRRPPRHGTACNACRCRTGTGRCGRRPRRAPRCPPPCASSARTSSRAGSAASIRRAIAMAGAHWPAVTQLSSRCAELRGTRDAVGKERRQRGQLGRRHDLPEIEQTVEAERLSDRIRGLEREPVGQRLAAEAYAVLAFEQRPERAADRRVLGLDEHDARVLRAPRAGGASAAKSRRCPRACRRRARTTWRRGSRTRGTPGPTRRD